MPQTSVKQAVLQNTRRGVLATLTFFGLYQIPLKRNRFSRLVYKTWASDEEIDLVLKQLCQEELVQKQGDWYGLKPWDEGRFFHNQIELNNRWSKVKKYFWLLSILPFVEHLSLINSLVIGNAHEESDIDFFVITKPKKLYFVRTLVILLFKALGLYKTRAAIKDRFCFGFYITSDNLDLSKVLIEGEDPLFAFWFASFGPLFGRKVYEQFVEQNSWIKNYFPNFTAQSRFESYQFQPWWQRFAKNCLEFILWLPAILLEPLLARIHISHTFNLPENHWPTATTVASKSMLKLHALDPRKEVREKFNKALPSISTSIERTD